MTELHLEWTWNSAKQQPLSVFAEWRDQQRRQLADKALALRNEKHSVNDAPSTLREKAIDFIFYTTSYTFPDYSLAPENYLELVKFLWRLFKLFILPLTKWRTEDRVLLTLKSWGGLIQKLIK